MVEAVQQRVSSTGVGATLEQAMYSFHVMHHAVTLGWLGYLMVVRDMRTTSQAAVLSRLRKLLRRRTGNRCPGDRLSPAWLLRTYQAERNPVFDGLRNDRRVPITV